MVLVGQDATIFFKAGHQFGLTREVKPIMEISSWEK